MDITPIVNAIIALVASLITVFVIPWLKQKYSADKLEAMLDKIDIFVAAAEQIAERDGYDGEWKKAHVEKMLEDCGYSVDDTVSDYIESAVLMLHNAIKGIE